MTLTQVALQAELSHSFLSQVERGLERMSMTSLFRVAQALGTTQQALLTDDADAAPRGRAASTSSGRAKRRHWMPGQPDAGARPRPPASCRW
jgi:transcriptional regulator with XRE-family HTH domain